MISQEPTPNKIITIKSFLQENQNTVFIPPLPTQIQLIRLHELNQIIPENTIELIWMRKWPNDRYANPYILVNISKGIVCLLKPHENGFLVTDKSLNTEILWSLTAHDMLFYLKTLTLY